MERTVVLLGVFGWGSGGGKLDRGGEFYCSS